MKPQNITSDSRVSSSQVCNVTCQGSHLLKSRWGQRVCVHLTDSRHILIPSNPNPETSVWRESRKPVWAVVLPVSSRCQCYRRCVSQRSDGRVFTAARRTDRAPQSPHCRNTEAPQRRRERKTGWWLNVGGRTVCRLMTTCDKHKETERWTEANQQISDTHSLSVHSTTAPSVLAGWRNLN